MPLPRHTPSQADQWRMNNKIIILAEQPGAKLAGARTPLIASILQGLHPERERPSSSAWQASWWRAQASGCCSGDLTNMDSAARGVAKMRGVCGVSSEPCLGCPQRGKATPDAAASSRDSAEMRAPAQRCSSSFLSPGTCTALPARKAASIACAPGPRLAGPAGGCLAHTAGAHGTSVAQAIEGESPGVQRACRACGGRARRPCSTNPQDYSDEGLTAPTYKRAIILAARNVNSTHAQGCRSAPNVMQSFCCRLSFASRETTLSC